MKRTFALIVVLFLVALSSVSLVLAQHNQHSAGSHGAVNPATDQRQFVRFPDALRDHTLANMRDHLLALQEIQEALASGKEDLAAQIAERRLGMSSLSLHGAHDVAQFMPRGMQDAGTEMHRGASRFAVEAQNAGVTSDLKPAYTYNWVGLQRYTIASDSPLPSGKSTVRLNFAYDGGGRGKGGTATLFVNGQKVAEGRVNNTNANLFSADEGADVGMDEDTPVTEAYQAGIASRFTGKIEKVTIEAK